MARLRTGPVDRFNGTLRVERRSLTCLEHQERGTAMGCCVAVAMMLTRRLGGFAPETRAAASRAFPPDCAQRIKDAAEGRVAHAWKWVVVGWLLAGCSASTGDGGTGTSGSSGSSGGASGVSGAVSSSSGGGNSSSAQVTSGASSGSATSTMAGSTSAVGASSSAGSSAGTGSSVASGSVGASSSMGTGSSSGAASGGSSGVAAGCGNGVVEGSEACDQGASNSDTAADACRSDCTLPRCGDGVVDGAETCDQGSANSDTAADACRTHCQPARCGDGVQDTAEACDNGVANSDETADACRRTCVLSRCGDGVVDTGEVCDQGADNSNARAGACKTTCTWSTCGDGTVDPGEGCDNGAANSDTARDACRTTCQNARCGDAVVDTGEACDDGDANNGQPNGCSYRCTVIQCGNGQREPGEQCDDGNLEWFDACSPNCITGETYAPTAPRGCNVLDFPVVAGTPTADLCNIVNADTDLTTPPLVAVPAPFTSWDWNPTCVEYYTQVCRPCPPWTLATCQGGGSPFLHAQCQHFRDVVCPGIYDTSCTQPTLALCNTPGFRTQSRLLPGTNSFCTDWIDARCTLLEAACPAANLDTCFAEEQGTLVLSEPLCAPVVDQRCRTFLSNNCGAATVARCSDLPATLAATHPACTARVQASCVDWEERLCPAEQTLTLTADHCTAYYTPNMVADASAACQPWLLDTCQRLIREAAQAHHAMAGGCAAWGTNEQPTGLGYDVVPVVKDPSRFDCGPHEPRTVQPATQAFLATPLESQATLAAVLGLHTALGDAQVDSCEQFVRQRYWNFEMFRTVTEAMGSAHRRAFQVAYSTAPAHDQVNVGARGMSSGANPFGHFPDSATAMDDGRPHGLGDAPGTPRAPKNSYGELLLPENADALQAFQNVVTSTSAGPQELRRPRNQAIAARMAQVQQWWLRTQAPGPNDGWHWHKRMSDTLGALGITDEELNLQYRRRLRFRALLAEYRQVHATYELAANNNSAIFGSAVVNLAARLRVIVEELETLLVVANASGCFSALRDASGAGIPSACDWAPADFTEAVKQHFEPIMQQELRRCRQYAPADFAALANGYEYLVAGNPPEWRTYVSTPALTVNAFDLYLDRRETTLALLPAALGSLPPEERPMWGQSFSDSGELGDRAWFSAGYAWVAGWRVAVPPGANGLCGVDARANADLDGYVYVANQYRQVLDAGVLGLARSGAVARYLRVGGVSVWNDAWTTSAGSAIDNINYEYNLVFAPQRYEQVEEASFTAPVFGIAGFSVDLTLGVAGRLGLDVQGALSASVASVGNCGPGVDVRLGAGVKPFAALDGFATLGVDLLLVEIGVGGSLNVISVGLPFSASVAVTTPGVLDALTADVGVQVDASLELAALSGRVFVYADTFWDRYESTIFSWPGYTWTTPLLRKSYHRNLGTLLDYCAIPQVDCN